MAATVVWLLLLACRNGWSAIALVQHTHAGGGNQSNTTVACTLNTVTSGNFLTFGAGSSTTSGTITVGDSNGTPSAADTSSTTLATFNETSAASGTHTITFTRTSTGQDFYCYAAEYSGMATSSVLDQASQASATPASMTSPSITTTNANDLIIGFAVADNGSAPVPSAGTGYTLLDSDDLGSSDMASEYKIVSATGSYTASYTFPGTNAGPSAIIAYKAAAAGITPSGTAGVCTAFAAATSGVVTRTEGAGNTVIVVVAIPKNNATVSSVTDTGGSSYTGKLQQINGTLATVEEWATGINASTSSTSVTINVSVSTKFVGCVFEYAGAQAFGNTNKANGSTANPSISLTTQDSNNYCVAGFAGQGTGTFTAGTGTLRASAVTSGGATASNVGGAFVDNTVASAGTCTTSVTNADTAWALATLELRTVAPGTSCGNGQNIALLGVGCR